MTPGFIAERRALAEADSTCCTSSQPTRPGLHCEQRRVPQPRLRSSVNSPGQGGWASLWESRPDPGPSGRRRSHRPTRPVFIVGAGGVQRGGSRTPLPLTTMQRGGARPRSRPPTGILSGSRMGIGGATAGSPPVEHVKPSGSEAARSASAAHALGDFRYSLAVTRSSARGPTGWRGNHAAADVRSRGPGRHDPGEHQLRATLGS